ncbi:MAG: hypothetical protein KA163_13165 [Bacteroidia bacterium]|nr:hypothetical protein [Bacteroidia bacterium]
MKKIKILSILLIASSFVFVYSCKKNTKEVDTETQSVVDNAICEQEFMQIQPTTNNLAIKTKGTSAQRIAGVTGGCDSLTYLSGDTTAAGFTNTNPPTFEYNYGICSLANTDGVIRTGKLWIRFLGRPKTAGSKTIIKLLNYKVNGSITYSCDSIVVTSGSNATAATRDFTVQIVGGMCVGNGWTVKYNSTKYISINTNSTTALSDDVVTVSGTANGTNRDGRDFDVVITSITKPANCKHITKGTVDVTPKDFSTRTVDFGSGTCDDDATFTVNGQTIAFKLK